MFSGYKIISDGNLISLGIRLEELDHVTVSRDLIQRQFWDDRRSNKWLSHV